MSYAAQPGVVGIGLNLAAKVLDFDPNDGFEGYAEVTEVELRMGIGSPPPPSVTPESGTLPGSEATL